VAGHLDWTEVEAIGIFIVAIIILDVLLKHYSV